MIVNLLLLFGLELPGGTWKNTFQKTENIHSSQLV